MKHLTRVAALLMALALVGCESPSGDPSTTSSPTTGISNMASGSENGSDSTAATIPEDLMDLFTDRDCRTEYEADGTGNVGYILTDECKCKKPASYTVREWLDLNGISTDDRIFITWAEMTTNSLKIMNITKKDKQQSKTNLIFNILTHYLYFAYDTNEDFITQLLKNAKAIQELLDSLKEPAKNNNK